MRRIREALHLVLEKGVSRNKAALALSVGRTTLQECLGRFHSSGMPLEDALKLSDADLERHLFPPVCVPSKRSDIEPDVTLLLPELKHPGVTMKLLWEEYRCATPAGLGYTQFRERIHDAQGCRDLVMRQAHNPGEKVMVDYSGDG